MIASNFEKMAFSRKWSRNFELMARHGTEHEQAHLESYARAGKSVARIETWGATVEAYWKAREQTLEAVRSGVDVIYQATLFDGRWLGYADFLERVDVPSGLGALRPAVRGGPRPPLGRRDP